MTQHWTPQQEEWLKQEYKNHTRVELTDMYAEKFSIPRTFKSISRKIEMLAIKKDILRKDREDVRLKHTSTMKRIRDRKLAYIQGQKTSCKVCGENRHPILLDWHHINPTKKSFALSRGSSHPMESIVLELEKCVCLCSNCHRLLHAGEISI